MIQDEKNQRNYYSRCFEKSKEKTAKAYFFAVFLKKTVYFTKKMDIFSFFRGFWSAKRHFFPKRVDK